MDEGHAVSLQPLQYEALSSEEPRPELLGKSHLDLYAPGGAEKRVLLTDDLALELG